MKEIYKKWGTLVAVVLPATTVLSCTQLDPTNPSDTNQDQSNDQAVVNALLDRLSQLPLEVTEIGKQTLPTSINLISELKGIIDDQYFNPIDRLIKVITTISSTNDDKGTLTVNLEVSKGQITKSKEFMFTGFLTTDQENQNIIENTLDYINQLPPIQIDSNGSEVWASEILTQGTLAQYAQVLTITAGVTVEISYVSNNSAGTLIVKYNLSKGKASGFATVFYSGFKREIL